jgi:hypothetical protein
MTTSEPAMGDRLRDALIAGGIVNLIRGIPRSGLLSEADMHGWGEGNDVPAGLVRELLLGRGLKGSSPDPQGLCLRGARIRGGLDLDLVDTKIALKLEDCLLEDGLSAHQAHLPMLCLVRCRISNTAGPAFIGDGLQVDGELNLHKTVFTAAVEAGALRLAGARVGGAVELSGAAIHNTAGPALHADRLHTGGTLFLKDKLVAEGVGSAGTVRLVGAWIGDALELRGAKLTNTDGPALVADRLHTEGAAVLDQKFTAVGTGTDGAVRLHSAHVGADLMLNRAVFANTSGPGLFADNLHTEGKLSALEMRVVTEDAGDLGALRLPDARIGGQLTLRGAKLTNTTGPALLADRLQTTGPAFLDGEFTATGAGSHGAVALAGARIGDQLALNGATLRNVTGPALVADHLQTGGNLFLSDGFTAEGGGDADAVRLPHVRIDGLLVLTNSDINKIAKGAGHWWEIDGLTYRDVPGLIQNDTERAWLTFLKERTSRYAAQPYQQLAAGYRAQGHDSDVRRTLMAQRKEQKKRGGLNRVDKGWAWVTGTFLGYGYQPWRALLWLLGIVVLSVAVSFCFGAQGGLARGTPTLETPTSTATVTETATPTEAATKATVTWPAPPAAPAPCTTVQTIGRGLDLGVPFLSTAPAGTGTCQPTSTAAGDQLTEWHWALQLIAWAFAALFIAGFTGIVRKT